MSGGDVDVCDQDPGFDLSVRISTTLRMLIRIWRGDLSWERAARNGALALDGSSVMRRLLPKLFLMPGQVWTGALKSKPRSSTGAEWVSAPTAM